MEKFLELEAGYLVIGAVVLIITLFVSTRPFFKKGAYKKSLLWVGLVLSIAIGGHYRVTTNRMSEVKIAFEEGQAIICESRMQRKVAQSVDVIKKNEWVLEGDVFTSPNYSRPFHTARCLVK